MTDVFLSSPVIAVGDEKHTVEESAAAGRLVSPAAALAAAGFRWHHVASSSTTAFDLAVQAVRQLADEADPDAIVYATCLPGNAGGADTGGRDVKGVMDYPASRLQARFGFDRAHVIGVGQQACTGLLGAVRIARALAVAEPDVHREVLCLTADRFPPGSLYEQAYNLVSDGAAACLVTATPSALRIVASHQLTNGALSFASDDETVGSYFAWTHRLVTELLERAGVATVNWVVPQNTNPAAWRILSRLLGIDAERVWAPTLPDVAHMISGDNLANLADLLASGLLRPGERVLLTMAGYGMNWQATLLEVVEA